MKNLVLFTITSVAISAFANDYQTRESCIEYYKNEVCIRHFGANGDGPLAHQECLKNAALNICSQLQTEQDYLNRDNAAEQIVFGGESMDIQYCRTQTSNGSLFESPVGGPEGGCISPLTVPASDPANDKYDSGQGKRLMGDTGTPPDADSGDGTQAETAEQKAEAERLAAENAAKERKERANAEAQAEADEKNQKDAQAKEDREGGDSSSGQATADTSGTNSDTDPDYCPADDIQQRVKQCREKQSQASTCCQSGAVGCAFGNADATMSAVGAMGMGMLQAGQSLSQECSSFKKLGNISAGLNSAMVATCQLKRNACEDECGNLATQIEGMIATTKDSSCKVQLRIALSSAENNIQSCERLMANQVMLAGQAAQALMANKLADICKDQVVPITPPVPAPVANDWCRTAKDLSNPYCKDILCAQPAYATNPICSGQNNLDVAEKPTYNNNITGGINNGDGFTSRLSETDAEGLTTRGTQNFVGAKYDPKANEAIKADGGGGGAGLPGAGGGGGSGGFGGGGSASARANGYDTNVLKGLSSGSGYTVAGGSFAGGGGYSNPVGGSGDSQRGKKFSLKDFLPKKQMDRKIAGLVRTGASAQLAGKHESIWNRVSNKYREMCHLNKLYCGGEMFQQRRAPGSR